MNFPDDPFTSGLPRRVHPGQRRDDELRHRRSATRRAAATARWRRTRSSSSSSPTSRRCSAPSTRSRSGFDVRRAYNLRVPSDNHRSGEIDFNAERTQGPSGGGLGLASFLLGDVSAYRRYVSTSTDAREEQWRWFVYAQDTWRADEQADPQLRAAPRGHHAAERSTPPATRGFLDISTGEMMAVGIGERPPERRDQEQDQLGAPPGDHLPARTRRP